MFNRRLLIFLIAVTVAMLVAVGRLTHLQLVRGGEFVAAAERCMVRQRYLPTGRGDILDRHGEILATDKACYEFRLRYRALLLDWAVRRAGAMVDTGVDADAAWATIETELVQAEQWAILRRWFRSTARKREIDSPDAAALLAEHVGWTVDQAAVSAGVSREHVSANIDSIVSRVCRIRKVVGMEVAEQRQSHPVIGALSEPVAVELRGYLDQMLDGSVGPSTRRWYPYSELACHIIGRLGRVTAEVLDADPNADDPLGKYRAKEKLGVTGIEKACESTLRGLRGLEVFHYKSGQSLEKTDATDGRDVRLTIDIVLQREITDLLRAKPFNGAAVVIDVATGDILAAVSKPTYDLNSYPTDFPWLNADEENLPLLNRAFSGWYAPGSTVKPITATAGLAEGKIEVGTTFTCRGHADPRRPRCWNRRGHGTLALTDAIMNSCNAYFSRVGERLGADSLTHWMRQFGLGEKPGTGLPGERSGLVPTRKWMRRVHRRSFYPGDARQMAIGQGLLVATPLQIANLMATIARGGEFRSPVLIDARRAEQTRRKLDVSPGDLAAVAKGLYRVVNDRSSQTAYRYARRDQVVMCGKTGTAQKRGRKDTAWFAGFAPAKRPTVAFAVVLDYAGGGGANCVAVAESMLVACKNLGYLND